MADYFIKNALNPNKVVKCNITLRQFASSRDDGELAWLLQVSTAEPHKNGGGIAPEFVRLVALKDLDSEIKRITESISEKVDWGSGWSDTSPPFVVSHLPSDVAVAGILSNVMVELCDGFPASGLDLGSIEMTVNGFDVSGDVEVHGDPFRCKAVWKPGIRVREYY